MRHITAFNQVKLTTPSVVGIGAFDGVHRGHQSLIKQLLDHAERHSLTPIILTFDPHPQMVLGGFEPGYYLTLPDAKAGLLGELGVEMVVTHPFNDEVRHIRATDFVQNLITHLNMQSLWVGKNFAMGYQREGNVAFLKTESETRGFDLRVIDLMDAEGERVSSTRIRGILGQGDVAEAARLLGRPYQLPGRVVEGAKRGRTIGFPTANLSPPEEQAVPLKGVYAAQAVVDGVDVPAVVNIGMRPTFDAPAKLTIEAHLLDFSEDLYGQEVCINFIDRLRDEMKFDGIDSLVVQINQDIKAARSIL